MWDLRPEIGNRRIKSIFIPGTHDSAAYGEHNENIGDTRVKKYAITQVGTATKTAGKASFKALSYQHKINR